MPQCHAKSKRSGVQCKKPAIKYGVCRLHGGASLSGKDLPSYKHGRYSKHIPTRMAATYEKGVHDRELLNMREDVALIDARVTDLLSRVDTGEAGRIWALALIAYQDVQDAIRDGDTIKGREANMELGALLRKGQGDYRAWDEVGKALEQKRKLIKSESKRQMQEKLLVPIAELGMVVQALAAAVSRYVTDVGILRAINEDWHKLLGRNPEPDDYWAPRHTANGIEQAEDSGVP